MGPGALNATRQAGRHAPVVLGDERPGHHLVEDRAQDPAMGDPVPALEAAVERELHPGSPGLEMEVELQSVLVQRPAGEAVMRRDLEAGVPGGVDRHAGLRRQGSAPCAPRP